MSERGTRRRIADWWERKTTRTKSTPSRALVSADSLDERLRNVYSFHAASPVIDEYLSSIQVDDDDPAFLLDWQQDNVNAFVNAANGLDPAQAPRWLRTRPPRITASSFVADVVYRLQPEPTRRAGHVLLAPNNMEQFTAIAGTLIGLQNDEFLQNAAQVALPVVDDVERYVAVTYYLTDSRVHRGRPNNLPPCLQNGEPVRRLFI